MRRKNVSHQQAETRIIKKQTKKQNRGTHTCHVLRQKEYLILHKTNKKQKIKRIKINSITLIRIKAVITNNYNKKRNSNKSNIKINNDNNDNKCNNNFINIITNSF